MCSPTGRVVVIDTEGHHGRALQYAPPGEHSFDFDHLKLSAPYSAQRYQAAFEAAEKATGAGGVVIIDSMSAEHESEGGALEEHHERTNGDAKLNMVAWAHIRPHQHALCRALTKSRCHVIACFRAEDKVKVVGNKPVPVGWQAIGWKRWPYEMQVCLLLSHERKGVPIVDGFDWGKVPINLAGIIPTDKPLTAEVGRRMAAWAAGGQKAPDSSPPPPDSSPDILAARTLYTAIKHAPDVATLAELDLGSVELVARLEPKVRDDISKLFNERLAEFQGPVTASDIRRAEELIEELGISPTTEPPELQRQSADDQPHDIADTIDREGLEPEEWRGDGETEQQGSLV